VSHLLRMHLHVYFHIYIRYRDSCCCCFFRSIC